MIDDFNEKVRAYVIDNQIDRRGLRFGSNVLTLLVFIVILFPLYWMINSSILTVGKLYTYPPMFIPLEPTLDNFRSIFYHSAFLTYYKNSIILSLGVVGITTIISTLAGYGLTRIKFPYKRHFARSILFGYMFPPILLGIPMYIIWREVGLINSYVGAILAITATGLPLTIWIMWQFFQTVPVSLEESARMAGASRFRAFYEIALPIARPGIMAIATFSYAHAWGDYTISKILLVDHDMWPLTIGLESFTTQQQIFWPEVMASAAMALIPSFLFLYILHQNWEVLAV